MGKIFNFEEQEAITPEEHSCETCELIDEMFDFIFTIAESRDEVIEYLADAAYEFKQQGYKDAMREIVMYGVGSIEDLDECVCDEDCDC